MHSHFTFYIDMNNMNLINFKPRNFTKSCSVFIREEESVIFYLPKEYMINFMFKTLTT